MPSRFIDYESELTKANQDLSSSHRHHHKSSNSSTHKHNTMSTPNSVSSTRSSFSSTAGSRTSTSSSSTSYSTSKTHRQRMSQLLDNTNPFLAHTPTDSSVYNEHKTVHSAHTTVTPTASIQEWAHQVHIQQRRRYEWCSECFPKTEPLHVPSEKAIRRVRIQEPTHCYN